MAATAQASSVLPQLQQSVAASQPVQDHSALDVDDLSEIELTLLTLRKPTELKKVVDSIPKPIGAVPKNGLPIWYKLGLECKLPVPKMPIGKIVFSRGKIGEDVRRLGLGMDGPRPSFDLTDPYCFNVTYDYIPMHDPHLAHHFSQKPTRNRMKQLGYCTKDGRAVCSLKEFNLYRKYLYNRFMDRIHMEMEKLDERARDNLTLKKVDADVTRRLVMFNKAEKAREHLERHAQTHADEQAAKKRLAKMQEKKIQARIKYLMEFNEKQRKERAQKAFEKEMRIKQRVKTAAEMELRRKISMVRQWRINEKRRLNRLKEEKEAREKRMEQEAQQKWTRRVDSQNHKIQEENLLVKLYMEDMIAGATRRAKRAEIYAYNCDLELQRIRHHNWKVLHGKNEKAYQLVKKMGLEFEKSKRGAKGMSPEFAQRMAAEAMATAVSNQGDTLMTLAQARARMEMETVYPSPPIRLMEQILESVVIEFARRRVHLLLRDVEREVRKRASSVFFHGTRQSNSPSRLKSRRFSIQLTAALAHEYVNVRGGTSIAFGEVFPIHPETDIEGDLKSIKDRPPTPMPSLTKLAEVTFTDKAEDLPDPVTVPAYLPERKKLLEMVNTAAKLLSRSVSQRVQKAMDLNVGKVTLPHMRNQIEWGEAVEALADAVVNNRVHADCPDVRRTSEFLATRVLRTIQQEMKAHKQQKKNREQDRNGGGPFADEPPVVQDFYVPSEAKADGFKANFPETIKLSTTNTAAPTVTTAGATAPANALLKK